MVYVPLETVKRLALRRWREALPANPSTPKPTWYDIKLEWYKMLEWIPQGWGDFDKFLFQFPPEDRDEITQKNRRWDHKRRREEEWRIVPECDFI